MSSKLTKPCISNQCQHLCCSQSAW